MRFPNFNDEWKETTLGEILDYEQPTLYIVNNTDYSNDSDLIPVLTANKSFVLGYVNEENVYDKGECIILDDFTLDIKFVDFPFKVKSSAIKILTAKKSVNIKTIYNYLLFMNLTGQEKDHKRHYISEVQPLSISLPSLAEQKKIADFFSLIDERITNLSETIKELKTQKAGLLNQLFSQKLRFPDFNDEWKETTLGEILSLAPQIPIDKPYIKDIISVKLHGKGISRTSATTLNLGATQYYLRRAGQLIYGKQNFHNGAIALIPKEYDNGITSKDIPSFVFNTTKSSPKYVLAYLLRVKYYETTEVYTTGTGSKRLKEDSFFSLPISLPSLAEQKKIADFLSLIDERIEVEEQLLKKYEEQKKYLLRQMFV